MTRISPSVGASAPVIRRTSVVLPAPDGPMIPTMVPAATDMEIAVDGHVVAEMLRCSIDRDCVHELGVPLRSRVVKGRPVAAVPQLASRRDVVRSIGTSRLRGFATGSMRGCRHVAKGHLRARRHARRRTVPAMNGLTDTQRDARDAASCLWTALLDRRPPRFHPAPGGAWLHVPRHWRSDDPRPGRRSTGSAPSPSRRRGPRSGSARGRTATCRRLVGMLVVASSIATTRAGDARRGTENFERMVAFARALPADPAAVRPRPCPARTAP